MPKIAEQLERLNDNLEALLAEVRNPRHDTPSPTVLAENDSRKI